MNTWTKRELEYHGGIDGWHHKYILRTVFLTAEIEDMSGRVTRTESYPCGCVVAVIDMGYIPVEDAKRIIENGLSRKGLL